MLVWAHGCNSLSRLAEARASREVTALEVDLCWNGTLGTAVTKHARESSDPRDEPAAAWLDALFSETESEPRGDLVSRVRVLKLDFKSTRAMRPTLEHLARRLLAHSERVSHVQVWINGDVLAGPGDPSAPPLDPHEFFAACADWPRATLSVGWTTDFHPLRSLRYEREHVDAMLRLLERYGAGRPVTFPIRASLLRDSWPELDRLLELPDSSLTLWTGVEGVPQVDVDHALARVRPDQIHVDCDKGPRHDFGHPARLVHYLAYVLGLV